MKKGKLYLIPAPLDPELHTREIPQHTSDIAASLTEFIVERERTARRVLRNYGLKAKQDDLILHDIGKHSDPSHYPEYLKACERGKDIGLLSEAGCPGVADPGAKIVALAHQKGIEVIPLVGPSSILLALMSSGMNGQNFAFHGYLPIDKQERKQFIQQISKSALAGQTQIFIETPFRVQPCLEDICKYAPQELKLSLALNLGTENQNIQTQNLTAWKGVKLKEKKPLGVFVLGR